MGYNRFRPIAISLAIHVVVLSLAAWAAYNFVKLEFPGAGQAIGVWITSLDGEVAGPPAGGAAGETATKPEPREKAKHAPQKTVDVFSSNSQAPAAEESKGAAGSAPEGTNSGTGSGTAESGGAAGGGGGKGNPILASIWRKINASKYYPSSARRRGLIGSPRVSFAIEQDGTIGWVKLAQSCGEAELDDAAIETVKRAAPLPYYAGPITLTVRYSLNQ